MGGFSRGNGDKKKFGDGFGVDGREDMSDAGFGLNYAPSEPLIRLMDKEVIATRYLILK